MKISIITICFNSEKTISRTINSVMSQKDVELEYILIDGKSSDKTIDIISENAEKNPCIKWISEKDNGIYDAMNKGLSMASGDIIGILNSDDFYATDNILKTVCTTLENNNVDSCYGNILYVKSINGHIKPFRYWKSGKLRTFKYGWMPPHPAFFVRKEVYEKYGNFRLDCGTAADYELMLRLLEKNKISSKWINDIFTYMEAGGASGSSLKAYKKSTINDVNAWEINQLKPGIGFKYIKKIRKLKQFVTAHFINIPKI